MMENCESITSIVSRGAQPFGAFAKGRVAMQLALQLLRESPHDRIPIALTMRPVKPCSARYEKKRSVSQAVHRFKA